MNCRNQRLRFDLDPGSAPNKVMMTRRWEELGEAGRCRRVIEKVYCSLETRLFPHSDKRADRPPPTQPPTLIASAKQNLAIGGRNGQSGEETGGKPLVC